MTNLIKETIVVGLTDSKGDLALTDIPIGKTIVSVFAQRNYGGDYYSGFFVVIPTISSGYYSCKCVSDTFANLSNTKVAVKVCYI